jgi:hypothetical protein
VFLVYVFGAILALILIFILVFSILKTLTSARTALILLSLLLASPFHDYFYSGLLFDAAVADSCGEHIYREVSGNGYLLGEGRNIRIGDYQLAPLFAGEFEFIETPDNVAPFVLNAGEKTGYTVHRISEQDTVNCAVLSDPEARKAASSGLKDGQCVAISDRFDPISRYAFVENETSYIFGFKKLFRIRKVRDYIIDLDTGEVVAEFNKYARGSWLLRNFSRIGAQWTCDGKPNRAFELPLKVIHPEGA